MTPEIIHSSNFVADAVALIEREADIAIFERGEFHLGLSGGTPHGRCISELAEHRDAWHEWIFSFGDERCVPPEQRPEQLPHGEGSACSIMPQFPRKTFFAFGARRIPPSAAQEYEDELRQRAPLVTASTAMTFSFSEWATMAIPRSRSFRAPTPSRRTAAGGGEFCPKVQHLPR